MVRVRDLEELDLVIARYREGIMVGGQPASVEVVVGQTFLIWWYIYGLVQDCSDSGALAMVILQSCTDSVIVASYELVHYRLIIIESSRFLFRWIHWSGRHRRVTNMQIMMTSWNGNISPLCGEFTSHQWIPLTKLVTRSFGVFFDLTWINGWVNNREAGDLSRRNAHCDVTVMLNLCLFALVKSVDSRDVQVAMSLNSLRPSDTYMR